MTTDIIPHLIASNVASRQWHAAERALDQILPLHLEELEARPALESAFVDVLLFGPYPVRRGLRAKLISLIHPMEVNSLEAWRASALDAIMAANLTWMEKAATGDLRYSTAQEHLLRALRAPADNPIRAAQLLAALTKVLDFAVHCEGSLPACLRADVGFLTDKTGDLALTVAFGANAAPFPFLGDALRAVATHSHYAPVVRTVVAVALHRASWPTLRSLFWLSGFPQLVPPISRRHNAVGRAFHTHVVSIDSPRLHPRLQRRSTLTDANQPSQ